MINWPFPQQEVTNKATSQNEPSVNCKNYPGEDMSDPHLVEWCENNRNRKKCLGCKLFPVDGPEVSIYQKNKKQKET